MGDGCGGRWQDVADEMRARIRKGARDGGAGPWRITRWLWLGAQEHGRDIRLLERLKIGFVVNLSWNGAAPPPGGGTSDVEFLQLEAIDQAEYPLLEEHLESCVSFLSRAKRSKLGALVHCTMGVNRSAAIVVASLMVLEGMRCSQAVDVVLEARGSILTNDGFIDQIAKASVRNDRAVLQPPDSIAEKNEA